RVATPTTFEARWPRRNQDHEPLAARAEAGGGSRMRDVPRALRGTRTMDASRKPLAKIEGRRRMRLSGVTVAWRGTPNLDDWVAYIINGTRSKRLILADHASERKVKGLLTRLQTMSRKDIEKLAKG